MAPTTLTLSRLMPTTVANSQKDAGGNRCRSRSSTGSSSSSTGSRNASSMCSLSSNNSSIITNTGNNGHNEENHHPHYHQAHSNPSRSRTPSVFLSPFASNTSLFHLTNKAMSVAADLVDEASASAPMRRISVPLQMARRSSAVTARRLSGFVARVGDAVNRELTEMGAGGDGNNNGEKLFVRNGGGNDWGEFVDLCARRRRRSSSAIGDDADSLRLVLDLGELPLPEGALQSQILNEAMLRQLMAALPARAEGYPWCQVYSSERDGFSLATLYRKMTEWGEEMSPILLVIRDVNGHAFGAIASTLLRPHDHYYGRGDASLLFRFSSVGGTGGDESPQTSELQIYPWTGLNHFFINANRDALSFGAGGGHYGLWLDADLNHGRSQKCETFDNEALAADDGVTTEDFVIQQLEAFGFSMSPPATRTPSTQE